MQFLPLAQLARLSGDETVWEERVEQLKALHATWQRQGVLAPRVWPPPQARRVADRGRSRCGGTAQGDLEVERHAAWWCRVARGSAVGVRRSPCTT